MIANDHYVQPKIRSKTELASEVREAGSHLSYNGRYELVGRIFNASVNGRGSRNDSLERCLCFIETVKYVASLGVSLDIGGLREHVRKFLLQAYTWMDEARFSREKPRRPLPLSPEQAQELMNLCGIDENYFRIRGISSYSCQGSFIQVLVDKGILQKVITD